MKEVTGLPSLIVKPSKCLIADKALICCKLLMFVLEKTSF